MDKEALILVIVASFGLLMGILVAVIVASARRNKNLRSSPPPRSPDAPPAQPPSQPTEPLVGPEMRGEVEISSRPTSSEGPPQQPEKKDDRTELKSALSKTEENFFGRFRKLFKGEISKEHLEEIEEILYTSDLGPKTVERLMVVIDEALTRHEKSSLDSIKTTIRREFQHIFASAGMSEETQGKSGHSPKPSVWMIVGVNGAGKTTSIGKLASQLAMEGKKVLIAAGDTFRAAAGAQLAVWSERAQVEIFNPAGITDPSALAFDAVAKAKSQNFDVVIVDTAGRLHTQVNLMEELKKVKRVMAKVIPEAPHEVYLVLDANSGQNALIQAKEFHQALGVTGVILTKMDGTAKGGVAVGVANDLGIPIRYIGVGEKIEDLRPFSPKEFVESILP